MAQKMTVDLAGLEAITPQVTTNLQDFCSLALETLKSYKPEIARVEDRAEGIARDVARVDQSLEVAKAGFEEATSTASKRMGSMEDRLMKLEALVAVLPTWKEDLLTRIETVGREGRMKADQQATRTQRLEDQLLQNMQATRERLDSLGQVQRALGDARAQHSERMDGLEKMIRTNDAIATAKLMELSETAQRHHMEITSNGRKLIEHSAQLASHQLDLGNLKARVTMCEGDIGAARGDILALQDKQELFHQSVMVMEKQMKAHDALHVATGDRVGRLEKEAASQRSQLQSLEADYGSFKGQVSNFMQASDDQYKGVMDTLKSMDARIEKGPPGLWKVTEQVAKQAEELAAHKAALEANAHQIALLENALANARALLASQKELSAMLEAETKALAERLASETKRTLGYVDNRLDHLAAKYEVEAVRQLVEKVRAELQEGIASMGLRVKFDLLHDEAPQVATIKAYMQQTEQAMARAQERMAYLEEGLQRETQRGTSLQSAWDKARKTLDQVLLDGDFDLVQIRRELQAVKGTFEELGKLASRGEILSLPAAEALMEAKLRGPLMDALVERKVAHSKALQQELQSYAPRHELEALRQVALTLRTQQLAGGGGAAATGLPLPLPTPAPAAASATAGGAKGGAAAQQQGSAGAAGAGGQQLPPPVREAGVGDSALMAVYARLAAVEAALAGVSEAERALGERLAGTERELRTTASQVEADLPALRQQLAALSSSMSGAGGPESPWAQDAARRLVNRTVLPAVLQKQAADTRRVVEHVERELGRSAKAYEVEALRRSVAALRAQLDGLKVAAAAPATAAGAAPGDIKSSSSSAGSAKAGSGAGSPRAEGSAGVVAAEGSQAAPGPAEAAAEGQASAEAAAGDEAAQKAPRREASVASVGQPAAAAAPEAEQPQAASAAAPAAAAPAAKPAATPAKSAAQPPAPAEVTVVEEAEETGPSLSAAFAAATEQQLAQLASALARLDALEKQMASLPAGGATAKPASPSPVASPAGAAALYGQAALETQVSDLAAAVHTLMAAQPTFAKGYDVEGLRRLVEDLSAAKLAGPAAAHATALAKQPEPLGDQRPVQHTSLYISLNLPLDLFPEVSAKAAAEAEAKQQQQQQEAAAASQGVAAEASKASVSGAGEQKPPSKEASKAGSSAAQAEGEAEAGKEEGADGAEGQPEGAQGEDAAAEAPGPDGEQAEGAPAAGSSAAGSAAGSRSVSREASQAQAGAGAEGGEAAEGSGGSRASSRAVSKEASQASSVGGGSGGAGKEGSSADVAAGSTAASSPRSAAHAAAAPVAAPAAAPELTPQQQKEREEVMAFIRMLRDHFTSQQAQLAAQQEQILAASAAAASTAALVAPLQAASAVAEERGRALEARWNALEGQWGSELAPLQAALPRLEQCVASVTSGLDGVRMALAAAPARRGSVSPGEGEGAAGDKAGGQHGGHHHKKSHHKGGHGGVGGGGGATSVGMSPAEVEELIKSSAALKEVVQQVLLSLGVPTDDSYSIPSSIPSPTRPLSAAVHRPRSAAPGAAGRLRSAGLSQQQRQNSSSIADISEGEEDEEVAAAEEEEEAAGAEETVGGAGGSPLHRLAAASKGSESGAAAAARPGSSISLPAGVGAGPGAGGLAPASGLIDGGSGAALQGPPARIRSARLALSARTARGAAPAAQAAAGGAAVGLPAVSGSQGTGGKNGSAGGVTATSGLPYGWEAGGVPRHLHSAEHADTELSGILHDLMHAAHAEMQAVKDGPLPGSAAMETVGPGGAARWALGARSVREAALQRLRTKPAEVQRHVELLEGVKKQLDRLVGGTAVSTVDYLALVVVMMDMRLKLMEDASEQHRDQLAVAFRNLEASFGYLQRLQEAVNAKGSASALAAVDKTLRALGREMCILGAAPAPGRDAGLLFNTFIGSPAFWTPFLSSPEAVVFAPGEGGSPTRPGTSSGGSRNSPVGGAGGGLPLNHRQRPSTAGPRLAPLPGIGGASSGRLNSPPRYMVAGTPFPPPQFWKGRDLEVEQQRVATSLALAEAGAPGLGSVAVRARDTVRQSM